MKCAVMNERGELIEILPVESGRLGGSPRVREKLRKSGEKWVFVDKSISAGTLVLQGFHRFFFFLG